VIGAVLDRIAQLDQQLTMITVQELRAALGGEIVSGQVLCPGPGHSTKDRSLAVKPVPGGFVVFSHAGDDWKECHDYVRERLGLPHWQPGDEQYRRVPPRHLRAFDQAAIEEEAEQQIEYSEEEKKRIRQAVSIWTDGLDPRGTLAEMYLTKHRKLDLPDDLAGRVLRFHPQCPFGRDENTGRTIFIPALVAAFRSIDTDEVTGIHRVALRPDGTKIERRMWGSVRRSAIKFDPISDTLAIGEGIESTMAGRELGFTPCWALGSTSMIATLPVIDGVDTLRILGENDKASLKAIEHCTPRWYRAGRTVRTVMPDEGCDDLNTELMRKKQLVPA
jgi:hypothetical protein